MFAIACSVPAPASYMSCETNSSTPLRHPFPPPQFGLTPLHVASRWDQPKVVEVLVAAGADTHATCDRVSHKALCLSCCHNWVRSLRLMNMGVFRVLAGRTGAAAAVSTLSRSGRRGCGCRWAAAGAGGGGAAAWGAGAQGGGGGGAREGVSPWVRGLFPPLGRQPCCGNSGMSSASCDPLTVRTTQHNTHAFS